MSGDVYTPQLSALLGIPSGRVCSLEVVCGEFEYLNRSGSQGKLRWSFRSIVAFEFPVRMRSHVAEAES